MDIEAQPPRLAPETSEPVDPLSPRIPQSDVLQNGLVAIAVAALTGYGQCETDGSRRTPARHSARGTSIGS